MVVKCWRCLKNKMEEPDKAWFLSNAEYLVNGNMYCENHVRLYIKDTEFKMAITNALIGASGP